MFGFFETVAVAGSLMGVCFAGSLIGVFFLFSPFHYLGPALFFVGAVPGFSFRGFVFVYFSCCRCCCYSCRCVRCVRCRFCCCCCGRS